MEVLSVSQSAYEYIKGKILTGEYKPGEQLEERRIAEELEISRPPMREAFRSLEHDHLIVNLPRRGNYVSKISVDHFIQLYEARMLAESGAIDILENKDIREIPGIETTLVKSLEHAISVDKPLQQQLHTIEKLNDFHLKIVEATKNQWLLSFYESISLNVCRYTFIYRTEIKDTAEDHERIYKAINNGMFKEAKQLIESHVQQYMQSPYIDLIQRLARDCSL